MSTGNRIHGLARVIVYACPDRPGLCSVHTRFVVYAPYCKYSVVKVKVRRGTRLVAMEEPVRLRFIYALHP